MGQRYTKHASVAFLLLLLFGGSEHLRDYYLARLYLCQVLGSLAYTHHSRRFIFINRTQQPTPNPPTDEQLAPRYECTHNK